MRLFDGNRPSDFQIQAINESSKVTEGHFYD
jgi:hypothetical protein